VPWERVASLLLGALDSRTALLAAIDATRQQAEPSCIMGTGLCSYPVLYVYPVL
jgi:hypothetical protein